MKYGITRHRRRSDAAIDLAAIAGGPAVFGILCIWIPPATALTFASVLIIGGAALGLVAIAMRKGRQ